MLNIYLLAKLSRPGRMHWRPLGDHRAPVEAVLPWRRPEMPQGHRGGKTHFAFQSLTATNKITVEVPNVVMLHMESIYHL